jgi:hypothetical protein
VSSVPGVIFYSFIAYVIIYTMSYYCTELIEDKLDYEKYVEKRIINKRAQKSKDADKLLKKMS